MAVKVYKNPKESIDRLINRFNKAVQGSRIIMNVKNNRYHTKKKTRRVVRETAIKREFYRSKRDKMQYY